MKFANCTQRVCTNILVGKNKETLRCFVHGLWLHDADAIARLLSAHLYGVFHLIGSVRMRECSYFMGRVHC